MMTRNKKKRTAGKDKSCPENSNQVYLVVPGNDAVEAGELVTMDHDRPRSGLDNDSQRMDYFLVAWLLREKLNDLVDGDKGEFPGLGLRSLLEMATSRNIVSVDPKMLNPILWRTLPKELLFLVLARLLVPDIIRLRYLSREWNRDMATVNSEFNRLCDEASPGTVAFFSRHDGLRNSTPNYLVTICTQRSQYSYRLHPGGHNIHENRWDDMGARDGGLVCFVSTWRPSKAKPLCIVVVNLLTRVRHKLPPLQYVYSRPPKMMHMEVDSATKCYRVVVVGKNIKGRPTVETYHSDARRWTKSTPPVGFIFGPTYTWHHNNHFKSFRRLIPTQCVYDFAKGQLKRCDAEDPFVKALAVTFSKDCKFVLHTNTSSGEILQAEGHCITQYRSQNNAKDWVQERSYLCSPFQDLLRQSEWSDWTLRACEGFLMVFIYSFGSPWHSWLLDLTLGEWRSLPNCFEGHECDFFMSRAFWNVIP